MRTEDLLVEIGTEELPPKALKKLSNAFADNLCAGLKQKELNYTDVKAYASPRRLAVVINAVDEKQQDKEVVKRGPALKAAFKEDGCASPAAEGFARSVGVSVDELETIKNDKGAWLAFKSFEQGKPLAELLPELVADALEKLPIPKRMRWSDFKHQFVRPIHWVVMLYGEDVVPCSFYGHESGRKSRGHRFHGPAELSIPQPNEYAVLLESEAHVIADFDQRKAAIKAQVEQAALDINGKAIIEDSLLNEVTGLVEWPRAVVGNFDKKFLDVPAEVLISAMQGHQKYFHVVDSNNKLMPNFITVANIESKNIESVKQGNERVIRPRLSDAEFFWEQDKKHSLASRVKQLETVVFQRKLGTLHEKLLRVEKLAEWLAKELKQDAEVAQRAAHLSKSDLMTEMVGEFPELQGIMGEYYALHDGENEAVAAAINEQYMPRFGGDDLPASVMGQIVAIADKMDTLVGIFGIGQAPTGDKDPFALRRAALGILRIIIEKALPLDLKALIDYSLEQFADKKLQGETAAQVFEFMLERLKRYYLDQNISVDVFESVRTLEPSKPHDFDLRVRAVSSFVKMEEAASLAAANKRIRNILKKAEEVSLGNIQTDLLSQKEERELYSTTNQLASKVETIADRGDYTEALATLAALKAPVDDFFDHVMVMDDDPAVRANRLALLNSLANLCSGVAELSVLKIDS
jgi:glycyl-tRNA synthetase beta chain